MRLKFGDARDEALISVSLPRLGFFSLGQRHLQQTLSDTHNNTEGGTDCRHSCLELLKNVVNHFSVNDFILSTQNTTAAQCLSSTPPPVPPRPNHFLSSISHRNFARKSTFYFSPLRSLSHSSSHPKFQPTSRMIYSSLARKYTTKSDPSSSHITDLP